MPPQYIQKLSISPNLNEDPFCLSLQISPLNYCTSHLIYLSASTSALQESILNRVARVISSKVKLNHV